MPKIIMKIKTWSCATCGYCQDFEPTKQNQDINFNYNTKFRLTDVKENECPSCRLRGVVAQMAKEIDSNKKIIVTITGEEDIETELVQKDEERNKEGKVLQTLVEKAAYRNKRKEEIKQAIAEAKLLEDI